MPGAVDLGDVAAVDDPAGGEVGTADETHQVLGGRLGIVDEVLDPLADLPQVVGRNVGGHADGDPAGAVDQQVGGQSGEHRRLLDLVGVVVDEIDGVLVDVLDQLHRHRRHPRLGVALRRGGVAVDRAEIPLAVDQRVPHHPGLGKPHQGVVDGLVAVGVIVLHHLAHDGGALAVA